MIFLKVSSVVAVSARDPNNEERRRRRDIYRMFKTFFPPCYRIL